MPQQQTQLATHIFSTWPLLFNAVKDVIHNEQFPIAHTQLRILKYVNEGYDNITDLAKHMSVRKPTISASVDTLVQKKFLKRERRTTDRRAIQLSLTSPGKKLLSSTHRRIIHILQKKLTSLTQKEQQTLEEAMTILERAFTTK